jgi:hypothetical protein
MKTLLNTKASNAASAVVERVERAGRLGPLGWSETDAFESLFRTRRVASALAQNNVDAEDFAEAILAATSKWTHAKLKDAATAAVFIAEDRQVRQWLWFSKADLAWALADALNKAMIAEGWAPSDLVATVRCGCGVSRDVDALCNSGCDDAYMD